MASALFSVACIGRDPALLYLLERYAQHCGCDLRAGATLADLPFAPGHAPDAVLFTSIEDLVAALDCILVFAQAEIPILVCAAVNEEAQALELGADYCLVHPLTYDIFLGALAAVHFPFSHESDSLF